MLGFVEVLTGLLIAAKSSQPEGGTGITEIVTVGSVKRVASARLARTMAGMLHQLVCKAQTFGDLPGPSGAHFRGRGGSQSTSTSWHGCRGLSASASTPMTRENEDPLGQSFVPWVAFGLHPVLADTPPMLETLKATIELQNKTQVPRLTNFGPRN